MKTTKAEAIREILLKYGTRTPSKKVQELLPHLNIRPSEVTLQRNKASWSTKALQIRKVLLEYGTKISIKRIRQLLPNLNIASKEVTIQRHKVISATDPFDKKNELSSDGVPLSILRRVKSLVVDIDDISLIRQALFVLEELE